MNNRIRAARRANEGNSLFGFREHLYVRHAGHDDDVINQQSARVEDIENEHR